jgi:YidC/Oxa1 family membrane protein insertase
LNGEKVTVTTTYKCSAEPVEIKPAATQTVSFDNWNNQLFSRVGDYKIVLNTSVNGEPKSYETMVNIHDSNWFGVAWDAVFYRPIYNTLIFIITLLPTHDLGWAIILLTILIRIILLIPNQRALEQQKKLQKIQPKLNEIQKKYEGDQQKIGEETMKLWKENKVNPLGSCLPILLQLPVLIGLYTAITHGLEFSSTYFLYEPLKNFNIETVSHFFFGLDLAVPDVIALPILLGVLQFIQMKLSLQSAEKKKKNQEKNSSTGKELKVHEPAKKDANAMMGKTMTYFLPLLIAFMALGFPAGVAVYWGVSTLFGIGQQIWVNREKEV